MDELILGLGESTTTTELILDACQFDTRAVQKLVHALKKDVDKQLAIQHITIEGFEGFRGQDMLQFFQLPCLHGLEVMGNDANGEVDDMIDDVNEGLLECTLQNITLSINLLARLETGLTQALQRGKLQHLELDRCNLSVEADAECLFGLLKNGNLRTLALDSVMCGFDFPGEESLEYKVFECLQQNSGLEKLSWRYGEAHYPMDFYTALVGSLPSLKLSTLKMSSSCHSIAEVQDVIGEIATTSAKENWSLEVLQFSGWSAGVEDLFPDPVCTATQQEQIAAIAERNRLKKLIFSASIGSMSQEDCIHTLASLWELPDWVSLTFWLLEEVPHLFF
eukprot:Sro319_g116110.1 n/a (336) ;mRNA; r:4956-5963